MAVGAIELIFALLFNLGAVIKAMRAGLKASAKAAAKAAKATVTTTIKNVRKLGRLGLQAGKTAIRNGKLVLKGIKGSVVKGAKSLDDLAKRLWKRVRFRKFKIKRSGKHVRLFGYINPWVLLADGTIEQVNVKGGRPELGELVDVVGRRKSGILIGVVNENPSTMVRNLQKLSKGQRRKLYRELVDENQEIIRRRLIGARETSRHAKQLRNNLESTGHAFKEGDEAHHLIPSTHPKAERARQILKKYDIDINDPMNGLPLSPDLHSGLHTNKYMDAITEALRAAESKEDVTAILSEIAKRIKNNKFP